MNGKMYSHVLKGQPSTDSSAMRDTIENRDRIQGELAIASAKLQLQEGLSLKMTLR